MFVSLFDTYQLISKLTFNRIKNVFSILSSYIWSRVTREQHLTGWPLSLSIEPTTACNLRCPECPSGLRSFTRPTGKLTNETYKKTIEELHSYSVYLTFYFQGEPFLNPDFLSMVRFAASKNLYTATSTNAHFLDDDTAKQVIESGLNRLIISIDGTTQETYASYRKEGSLSKVLAGTANVIRWKEKLKSQSPVIVWQFLVVQPNEHQIEEVQKLGKEYGVDKVALKTAQVYDYENGNDLIPSIDKYSRYRKTTSGKYEIKNKLLDHCWKMWSSCVITWDGKVIPCCFDKDAHYELGNVSDEKFVDIWHSEKYKAFRHQLMQGRDQIEMCKNCTEGTKVWA